MTLNFVIPEFHIGGAGTPPLQFFRRGFNINGSNGGGSWTDIILKGNTALTLTNCKQNGLNAVRLFGNAEQRNLPEGYTQLEYIESDGTQYIDIDVSGDVTFIGTAQSTTDSPTTSQVLVANSGASAGHWFGVQSPGISSPFAKRWGLGATATASSTIDGTTKVDFEITFTQSSQYGTVNDQVLNRESSTSAHTNWVIFAGNATPSYGFIGKVWKLQVVQNDVLVRDFVPCKNSSNIAGMYDLVSGRFFGSLTASNFVAGATAVPSPTTPMDIVSNNGTIKARHQSGLPLGYTKIEYIEGDGNQYIDTGYFFNNIATETLTLDFMRTASSTGSMLYGTRTAYKNNGYAMQFTTAGATYIQWGDKDTGLGSTAAGALNTRYTAIRMGAYYSFNGADYTITDAVTPTQNYPLYLFCVNNGGTAGTASAMRIYSVVITDSNNAVKFNAIPCKNSSNVIGLYDTVSGTFMENKGTGNFTAGNPVSDAVEIYTDGTVETVEVFGKNLFDINTITEDIRYNDSGEIVTDANVWSSDYISVLPSTAYTYSFINEAGRVGTLRMNFFDKQQNWISVVKESFPVGIATFTETTPSNAYYIRTSQYKDVSDVQLEKGSTATTYEAYFNGGQATAEMLLAVGTYQDVQSVLDGQVTRNVGIKVLDGTEDWVYSSGYSDTATNACFYMPTQSATIPILPQSSRSVECLCSHFIWVSRNEIHDNLTPLVGAITGSSTIERTGTSITLRVPLSVAGTTPNNFKQWLSDQYAQGTPVIVVYPLATATTEVVTAQPLTIQAGTNIVEITQASIDNLGLEVSYKGVV